MTEFDIIIVGGGMVGASLACALMNHTLKIALIDAAPLNTKDDPRLIALNHSSVCFFKNLAVWDDLIKHAEPIYQVHISDQGQFGMTRLTAREVDLNTLGHVVPAKYINAALDKIIHQTNQITVFRPATLNKISQTSTQVEITLATESGEINLAGKLLIAADGTHSTVRKELNIPIDIKDHQQSALVTVTTLQRPHQNIAYERFHRGGAIAMLPLPELQAATIWTDDNAVIDKLLQLPDHEFLATLQKQFGYRMGKLLQTSTRHRYPLQHMTAARTCQQRILLIGNAAHTFHPIAAQGFNLALAEIAMLVQFITDHPGREDWSDYAAWQTQRQTTSHHLSERLPSLFAQDFLPLKLGRQLGLLALDICTPLKTRFTRAALGKMNNMPRLLLDHDEH
ncbi:MAG: FAD-dependent monooxygenase [Pseudomonadota bacterium]